MRITYVARHGQTGSNDDEGAITHALHELGHEVETVQEFRGDWSSLVGGDLLLFHHWDNREALRAVTKCPKVFWYFDMVDHEDETLRARCLHRKNWMAETVPLVDLGFCTDGDWALKGWKNHDPEIRNDDKLVWLPQGFNERLSTHVLDSRPTKDIDLLLTAGYYKCGRQRRKFIDEVRVRYGLQLHHVTAGRYGPDLASLIGRSRIVLAPDAPGTDSYWSNRVYLTLGLGGFLLHPWSEGLIKQYEPDRELTYYRSREGMYDLVKYFLQEDKSELRDNVAANGKEQTLREHTYRHRIQYLLRVVRDRLGVG